jgi:histone deacetylase complex regulatory component SIN3
MRHCTPQIQRKLSTTWCSQVRAMRYKKALDAKGAANKMAQAKGTTVSAIHNMCRTERRKQKRVNIDAKTIAAQAGFTA